MRTAETDGTFVLCAGDHVAAVLALDNFRHGADKWFFSCGRVSWASERKVSRTNAKLARRQSICELQVDRTRKSQSRRLVVEAIWASRGFYATV